MKFLARDYDNYDKLSTVAQKNITHDRYEDQSNINWNFVPTGSGSIRTGWCKHSCWGCHKTTPTMVTQFHMLVSQLELS